MDARQKARVKYALALYRHQMGFRGPIGHGSGFDWIDGQDKAEIEEIVADRVMKDSRFRVETESPTTAGASRS